MSIQIKTLADYDDLCGESPIWSPQNDCLYWTDINGRRFHRYSWNSHRSETVSDGFEVAGFSLSDDGDFVVVNSEGFWRWKPGQAPQLIAAEVEGRRCAMNDCVADPRGRVFAGSTFFNSASDDYESGCLFRLDSDGSVQLVDEGFGLSNGAGFSPDERTFYFTDSVRRAIYAYDYRADNGGLSRRRVFVKVPDEEGIPDGLTVDAAGYVWSAQWFGGCIVRYDPEGKEERRVTIPASQVTSLAFGGPELTDIFVTSASFPDALPLAPPGYSPESRYPGGKLFHLNQGIPGKLEYHARGKGPHGRGRTV